MGFDVDQRERARLTMLELTICSTINYDDKGFQIRKKGMEGGKFAAAPWITQRSVPEVSIVCAEGCASKTSSRAPPPLAGRLSVVLLSPDVKVECPQTSIKELLSRFRAQASS
ncbi:hypothetical protein E4U28_002220 [Claviceps purpurea]|nr:hypothetical protein E4U28_002220 [Claviceps purpurea]